MRVYVESRDFKKKIEFKGKTLRDLFKQMGLISENFIVSRNNKIIIESEKLKKNDKVKFYPVISGG